MFLVLSVTIISIRQALPQARAQTASWNFSTPSEYSYDSDSITMSDGIAQLKSDYTPGVDWIANDDGGGSWGFRRQVSFDNRDATLGITTENLLDFPVLVKLNSENIDYSKTKDSGQDIRFTDSNGTTSLSFEIEQWNESGDSFVWVKVSQIDQNSNQDYIYLYYGNSIAEDGQDVEGTWNANYKGVWHLQENPASAAPQISDSTSQNVNGTSAGGMTVDDSVAGVSSNALEFDGANDYISYGDNYDLGTGDLTADVWFKTNGLITHGGIIGKSSARDLIGRWSLLYENNNLYAFHQGPDGNKITYASNSMRDSQWHKATMVIDRDAYLKLYIDGAFNSQVAISAGVSSNFNTSDYFFIGSYQNNTGMDYFPNYAFNGSVDEARISQSARSAAWVAASYKSEKNEFCTFGSESAFISTSSPTITPVNSQGYTTLSAFAETLGEGSSGSIKYQISPDDGVSWYWYTGGTWTLTSSGVAESSTASEINSAISSFEAGSSPRYFLWRAYLVSDGSQVPKLDLIEITHVWDTVAPDNVSSISQAKYEQGGEDITSNNWYNSTTPYFTWDEPNDNAGEGENVSGIDGYYVYFGQSLSADPTTAGTYQSTRTYSPSFSSVGTYYLFIETKDVAGNIKHVNLDPQNPDEPLFIYKYEGTDPTSPLYVSSSPSGYSRTNSFTFSWPTTGASMAQDSGGSLLAGYQYKINGTAWSDTISTGSVTIDDQGETGVNIFYLRAIDNAGNFDQTPVQTNFYYNASAPTAPRNLSVDPISSENNSFSFSWQEPSSYNGSIDGYYYSINAFPTLSNTSYTQDNSLDSGPFATQQGENTFYIVAKDEAGNYDFASCNNISGNTDVDGCAKVVFTANTSAPGIPSGLSAFDISNRDTQEYATTLKWTAPQDQGTGFAGYEIYRSTDDTSFTLAGTTSGTTYADTDLQSRLYYYQVKAKDNAGQYSSASTTVSITPTGRYTSAPVLTEEPVTQTKVFTSTISWRTDRESSSFVEYGLNANSLGEENNGKTVGKLDSTLNHSVQLEGLNPETTYYYQAVWVDEDGNRGESETLSFTTGERPKVMDVKATNITLNSAIVSYTTNSSTYSEVHYGKTSAYGNIVSETSGSQTTNHIIALNDLDHSSTYHYTIIGEDVDGNTLDIGADFTFDTLPMPKVENLRFESVQAATTTVKVVWKTNVPTSSEVVFTAPSGTLSRSDAALSTDHELLVDNLADSSVYSIVAKGRDQFGNQAQSDTNSFTTPIDTRAPSIYDIVVETSNVASGRQDESQVLVSWRTDEPATSRVEYGEGITGDQYESKTTEDAAMTNSHLVVVSGLSDSSPYHLRVCSKDKGANETCSSDNTIVPGESKKSLFTIIVGTFKRTFGWLEMLM